MWRRQSSHGPGLGHNASWTVGGLGNDDAHRNEKPIGVGGTQWPSLSLDLSLDGSGESQAVCMLSHRWY